MVVDFDVHHCRNLTSVAVPEGKNNTHAILSDYRNNVFSFLFWILVESIYHMQEAVAGHDVGVRFGTTLGVDDTGNVVELAEEVEAIKHNK